MRVLLLNENIRGSVSNEQTMWSVLGDALPDARSIATSKLTEPLVDLISREAPSVVVFNSLLGELPLPSGVESIALLQDNFVAMDALLPKGLKQRIGQALLGRHHFYPRSIEQQRAALRSATRVASVSENTADWYEVDAEIIPIGTDSTLFMPMKTPEVLRQKHQIPTDRLVKIFVGSTHPVKGWDLLQHEMSSDRESFYILVLKDDKPVDPSPSNAVVFRRVPQSLLAELFNCADIYVGRSRVETLWLAPIEAMFCGVPVDVSPTGLFADWMPSSSDPRQEVLSKGLDQATMIERWARLVGSLGP